MKPITATIKGAVKREGYTGKRLSKITGLAYSTLCYRYEHPETWKLYEIGAVMRHVNFLEGELQILGKEVKKL